MLELHALASRAQDLGASSGSSKASGARCAFRVSRETFLACVAMACRWQLCLRLCFLIVASALALECPHPDYHKAQALLWACEGGRQDGKVQIYQGRPATIIIPANLSGLSMKLDAMVGLSISISETGSKKIILQVNDSQNESLAWGPGLFTLTRYPSRQGKKALLKYDGNTAVSLTVALSFDASTGDTQVHVDSILDYTGVTSSPCPQAPVGCSKYDPVIAEHAASTWSCWAQQAYMNEHFAWASITGALGSTGASGGNDSAGINETQWDTAWEQSDMAIVMGGGFAFHFLDADKDEAISRQEFSGALGQCKVSRNSSLVSPGLITKLVLGVGAFVVIGLVIRHFTKPHGAASSGSGAGPDHRTIFMSEQQGLLESQPELASPQQTPKKPPQWSMHALDEPKKSKNKNHEHSVKGNSPPLADPEPSRKHPVKQAPQQAVQVTPRAPSWRLRSCDDCSKPEGGGIWSCLGVRGSAAKENAKIRGAPPMHNERVMMQTMDFKRPVGPPVAVAPVATVRHAAPREQYAAATAPQAAVAQDTRRGFGPDGASFGAAGLGAGLGGAASGRAASGWGVGLFGSSGESAVVAPLAAEMQGNSKPPGDPEPSRKHLVQQASSAEHVVERRHLEHVEEHRTSMVARAPLEEQEKDVLGGELLDEAAALAALDSWESIAVALESNDPARQELALRQLRDWIVRGEADQAQAMSEVGDELVMMVMEANASSAEIQTLACAALFRMIEANTEFQGLAAFHHGVETLLTSLQEHLHSSAELAEAACWALEELTLSEDCCQEFVDFKGIAQVTLCLELYPADAGVQEAANLVIANIANCRGVREQLASGNVLFLVTKSMREHEGDPQVQEAVCKVIEHSCSSASLAQKLQGLGVAALLDTALGSHQDQLADSVQRAKDALRAALPY